MYRHARFELLNVLLTTVDIFIKQRIYPLPPHPPKKLLNLGREHI